MFGSDCVRVRVSPSASTAFLNLTDIVSNGDILCELFYVLSIRVSTHFCYVGTYVLLILLYITLHTLY